jgi:RNA polymerase sigma factor (sigma-70 family)
MEPNLTDEELVNQCRAGDKGAFGRLIVRHRPRVERVLLALFGNRVEVDDVAQEAFLQAYLGLAQLRQPARFGAWVSSIAVNVARLQLRSARPVQPEWLAWTAAPPTPEAAAEQSEAQARLRQAIANLPAAEREAIGRVYLDGLSHQETARLVGSSANAVKVRVHRGRQRLAAALAGERGAAPAAPPAREVMNMIEVTVWDVLAKAAEGGENGQPIDGKRIVLLKEKTGNRALPIWIGEWDALDIARQLKGQAWQRPVTVDLMRNLLDLGGVQVKQAAVTRLHEQIFYGTLTVAVASKGETAEVDCRPSDGLSLGLRLGIPVFVAAEVMDAASIIPDEAAVYDVQGEHDRYVRLEGREPEPLPAGVGWRSLRI